MSEIQLSTRRLLELMQQLQQLADERAQSESDIAATQESKRTAADEDHQTTSDQVTRFFSRRRREVENDFAAAKSMVGEEFRQATQALQEKFEQVRSRSEAAFKSTALAIERKKKEAEWQALAVFDAAKDRPRQMLEVANNRIHSRRVQIDGLERDANTLIAMRRLTKAVQAGEVAQSSARPAPNEPEPPPRALAKVGQQRLNQLHQAVLELQAQRLPSLLLEGSRWIGWWVASCVLMTIAFVSLAFGVGWSPWLMSLGGVVVGTVGVALAYFLLAPRARRASLELYQQISTLTDQSRQLEQQAENQAQTKSQEEAEAIARSKHESLAAAQDARDQAIEQNEDRHTGELQQAEGELDAGLRQAEVDKQAGLAAADDKFPPFLDQIKEERAADVAENQQRYEQTTSQVERDHDTDWKAMSERWHTGFGQIAAELAAMRDECGRLFPDWSVTAWTDWQRPDEPPPAMQLGSCHLPLQAVKNGLSQDPRLIPETTELQLPALMTVAEQPRLVITAADKGRAAAVAVLQAMMLRYLTTMPAGKLRFTIIDPSALGENFASFMHLADYDRQLIGKRIWTDARQIDEQLMLLSDHMENVLQKYLRNEFESIDDYNRHAGEVSEPYHVLVVANFPAGLSDASIRRLATISATGPRCGVYTLMSIDTSLKLPMDFQMEQLLTDAVHLEWADERLLWRYPLFEKLPLELDALPTRVRFNELLRVTGEESQVASRVEVPFAAVAPEEGQLWSESTARELIVPIGRAAANELQSLRLGRGTSQHALVSGKTGSGKSTLLHALVTNAALHYSPREMEFYLVDFKKGVEFKAYATGELPHARVIAIESEREFGVSVLERLDEELRQRGERFRELGVQDLAGARAACDDRLPRILLVIDEFQELFVIDDKLSQDAALLLDRLVRQGRAFGIHVLLGSQTLAGAYSLARSTIGQMAVRIALECSEADAHLILSDDNAAARLLSRPGEAIYNDQNGLVEGNSHFQVVWLPDQERQDYLAQIHTAFVDSGDSAEPAIVFEGNVAANPDDNPVLSSIIAQSDASDVAEPTIWLGSAVRIEPPTQVTLRRQSGNHLLVVGQDETLALGILATSVCALAAQQRDPSSQLTILDGARSESPEQGTWTAVADVLPGDVQVIKPRQAAVAISALAAEVTRRSESPDDEHPPHFVVVHDLAQFRDLRLTEDDFSFSSSGANGKPTSTDKLFRELLREGPAVGMHVLVWCDSYNSMTRSIDRLALREVDFRVAMQMSAADSTSLIDSPAASQLGEHRAILYRDDLGTCVKFRPYGRPTAEWLAWVGKRLARENLARS